jgi:ABC-type multidrug transport system ATPase subunit
MVVLRELAMQGKTIITSIHQPSSQIFQSFDQLILLADGKTIYMVIITIYPFY